MKKKMKLLTISVGDAYVVPTLFDNLEENIAQHEKALTIGAKIIEEVGTESEIASLREKLQLDRERFLRELDAMRGFFKNETETQTQILLDKEREKIAESVRAENREFNLKLRELNATEKEEAVRRAEQRHATSLMLIEQTLKSALADKEALRKEHEGLVLKLMSRLEPTSSRSTSNAATLGRTFEQNVEHHLRQAFGARDSFSLEDVHSTGHSGDLIMSFDGLRILIELKSYDPKTRVPTKEVEKLARDLAEIEPRCDAAIMIAACSEITGHYSCGPLEVSSDVACVPVLFINNFLSLGEPQVTLHMSRVFLAMIKSNSQEEVEISEDQLQRAKDECTRRCTGYLADLSRQSTDLLRQVTVMKNGATKLRETVLTLVETETARFSGLIQLMSCKSEPQSAPSLDRNIFIEPSLMSEAVRELARKVSVEFTIGDLRQKCATKDIIQFIQTNMKVSSEKTARDFLKSLFNESVIKHGFILGLVQKTSEVE